MAFDVQAEEHFGGKIVSLGEYRPWSLHIQQGGDGGSYPLHSSRTLDLKEGYGRGIKYFFDFLAENMTMGEAIAVVPSSDSNKGPHSGCHELAEQLCERLGKVYAGSCLVRHTSIAKKAKGGDRSMGVDLNSIRVENAHLIRGKVVVLLDDVTSTGNSLLACKDLLLRAGAKEVRMLALARTTH